MIIDFLFGKIIVLPHLLNFIFDYLIWPDHVTYPKVHHMSKHMALSQENVDRKEKSAV